MNPIRRVTRAFGFDLVRQVPKQDVADYRRLYGDAAVRERRFYNIGAGPFRHPGWLNFDLYAGGVPTGHVAHDLMSLTPLPREDGQAELVYCGHVLGHLNDEAALYTLREAHRLLKPGGLLRLVVCNTRLAYEAWRRNDRDFFFWIHDHDASGYWRQTNLRMPLGQATLAQVFLEDFASTASAITVVGAANRIDDAELEKIFSENPLETALDYCAHRCPPALQSRFPYHRMNWFHEEKLVGMMRQAGFENAQLSAYLQSRAHVFRNRHYFDSHLPQISLYAEAVR
jgi:predicted SAM-dependent methyltransferase